MATELRPEPARPAIRALRAKDAGAVAEILRQSPEAVLWPEASVKDVLGWSGVLGLAIMLSEEVTGFLIGRQGAGEAEVLNLAVSSGNRRRGYGGALLKAAVEQFRARGVTCVFLEVRESNAAGIAFYGKQGFSKVGRREGYYRDPVEAAVVMEKKLTE